MPAKALKQTLRIHFNGSTCDLKPNQRDISAWCNCNIMRVDKTLLFNTTIFTCHLSLSLRSVNRIDSISSKALNTNWKKKKKSPIWWQTQFTMTVANISQPGNAQTHRHTHTITKQGFGDWGFGGVYAGRIWTVNLGVNSV